ncbi:hypothetical protein OIU85_013600 [Salix viminalis]|uniref:Uncharacterized protein n=1 Tax=Salix viminalis TaxID=40686 RepID=A0A9Q0NM00_SALVM|nr:hypothetical protein OIU85_013600 [Salix viminalis]
MPRTTTLECPGCPPLRALTFDSLVIESRGERGIPQVVERWGDPDPSKCVLAASIDDRKKYPLLAVARKNGEVEAVNPLNGEIHAVFSNEREAIWVMYFAYMYIKRKCKHEVYSMDGSENYAVFGGKGVEVNLWDLEDSTKIWTAKPPPKNSLGIFTPSWFTCTTFQSNDDHRKFVAGTNSHQVHLYDISAQRRPVLSFDFRETAIKAVTEDQDGHTLYIGNGSGDLASFDMRTGTCIYFD